MCSCQVKSVHLPTNSIFVVPRVHTTQILPVPRRGPGDPSIDAHGRSVQDTRRSDHCNGIFGGNIRTWIIQMTSGHGYTETRPQENEIGETRKARVFFMVAEIKSRGTQKRWEY